MTIDFARPVQTRDGRPVEIITTKGRGSEPVIGYIGISSNPATWTREGIYSTGNTSDPRDLVNAPEERELWLNVYESGDAECYAVREDADNSRSSYERIACVHVKYKVGEGLE